MKNLKKFPFLFNSHLINWLAHSGVGVPAALPALIDRFILKFLSACLAVNANVATVLGSIPASSRHSGIWGGGRDAASLNNIRKKKFPSIFKTFIWLIDCHAQRSGVRPGDGVPAAVPGPHGEPEEGGDPLVTLHPLPHPPHPSGLCQLCCPVLRLTPPWKNQIVVNLMYMNSTIRVERKFLCFVCCEEGCLLNLYKFFRRLSWKKFEDFFVIEKKWQENLSKMAKFSSKYNKNQCCGSRSAWIALGCPVSGSSLGMRIRIQEHENWPKSTNKPCFLAS